MSCTLLPITVYILYIFSKNAPDIYEHIRMIRLLRVIYITGKKKVKGVVVPPSAPRRDLGLYWGYTVRLASSLSTVFTQGPHNGGYDLTIGTSERGTSVDNFTMPHYQ